ncbi:MULTISPECIES: quinone-dependent dihydroorotate dehydrogenase [Kordiimonas]|jgi:dihydroorotate dehydrogenase|uniref:Dihydroorotate dehydrogenase (quinone) n=1 Tax=Kordiimonas lacus TaxID=637679 RepID=A0A1G6TTE0_9PROT|nr:MULTISPECIES: quinone-dependent dihydroorotate dehydrogenase [Kordiimonas]SDD31595.1 dihydroorotate oxidase A [Kordiimonas lacus]
MINLFPLARPFVHALDPENAHNLTIAALKHGVTGCFGTGIDDPVLASEAFGLRFLNPVGLAAGFDKNADAVMGAQKMGFGFTEAGTVTPRPQSGNDKPRLFRLSEDRAVINRFGFNNEGLDYFENQMRALPEQRQPVGANVGANKDTEDRTADYVTGIRRLYGLSDYFTVNISSPNTPGLRALQSKAALEDLIGRVLEARTEKMAEGHRYIPMLVKIAPDLLEADITDIADLAQKTDIDGLIVSNTTITRPDTLKSAHKGETGGLSGAPLMSLSTETLGAMYQATGGKVPLVGVGGIASGQDAYAKIKAGAALVQLYSMLVYEGPALVHRVKRELAALLKADGFNSVGEAVGVNHR